MSAESGECTFIPIGRSGLAPAAIVLLLLGLPSFGANNASAQVAVECVVGPQGTDPGTIAATHDLTPELVLVGAERGLFLYDIGSGSVSAVVGPDTGWVSAMLRLAGETMLIGAERGLFLFSRVDRSVLAVGGPDVRAVRTMHRLPDERVLINAAAGLYLYDPGKPGLSKMTGADVLGSVGFVRALRTGSFLIETLGGLWRYDLDSEAMSSVRKYDTLMGVGAIQELRGERVLIAWSGGELSVYDINRTELSAAGKLPSPGAFRVYPLSGESYLLFTIDGPTFRFDDVDGGVIEQVSNAASKFSAMSRVSDQGLLLGGSSSGVFRYDLRNKVLSSVGGTDLSRSSRYSFGYAPMFMQDLTSGSVLIGSPRGIFVYDDYRAEVRPARGADPGGVWSMAGLLRGGALLATERGLYVVREHPMADGTVEHALANSGLPQLPRGQEIGLLLLHPCASSANDLELVVSAVDPSGQRRASTRARLADGLEPGWGRAHLSANVVLDQAGDWTLELMQGSTRVGDPVQVTVGGPPAWSVIWEWMATYWRGIVAAASVAYAIAFVALMAASRRSVVAFRVLNDAVWARLLTWPFFLLRHVPAVQRWVLEPWFQAIRGSLTEHGRGLYLDPPVISSDGRSLSGSLLLGRLKETRRIWMQGRTGMGKSAVFAAWERLYFGCPTLADAAARYGAILVMLPVRHYAGLEPPDRTMPEDWLIESVRRRFEEFGFDVDRFLVVAMLKAGHIAVVLDGTNEADRDLSLTTFARQFSGVAMLVTSQVGGGDGWEEWRLPEDVGTLRRGLLALWLGENAGAILERRLSSEVGIQASLSGYDLRLVADLAAKDPQETPLPEGRLGLYRAVLTRVVRDDGEVPDLTRLRQLALEMLLTGRRDFSDAEGAELGAGVLGALSREGMRVVRRTGSLWEFRHDQMRAFLASQALVEDTPTLAHMIARMEEGRVFALPSAEQEALWAFVVELVRPDDSIAGLWDYAQQDPKDRGLLQAALQREADERGIALIRATRRPSQRKKAAHWS